MGEPMMEEFEDQPNGTTSTWSGGYRTTTDGISPNLGEVPLLTARTKGRNAVVYLKVVRLDGGPGVRGYKGRLSADATLEELAREYGNGLFRIEGCDSKGHVKEQADHEVAVPERAEQAVAAQALQRAAAGDLTPALAILERMATSHQAEQAEVARSSNDSVREMAATYTRMMTDFTNAGRESERSAFQAMVSQQQQFFVAMLQMQQANNATVLQVMARNDDRDDDGRDPVDTLLAGIELAQTLGGGGEGEEPMVAALREGSGMLGNLVQLMHGQQQGGRQPPPGPRQLGAGGDGPGAPAARRPRPLAGRIAPEELREFGGLAATLRQRGIPVSDYLRTLKEQVERVPDSVLFDAGEEGPGDDGSDDDEAADNDD